MLIILILAIIYTICFWLSRRKKSRGGYAGNTGGTRTPAQGNNARAAGGGEPYDNTPLRTLHDEDDLDDSELLGITQEKIQNNF